LNEDLNEDDEQVDEEEDEDEFVFWDMIWFFILPLFILLITDAAFIELLLLEEQV